MKESGRYLSVFATTLILASCRPVAYPKNPTPPPATLTVPSTTLRPETNDYQLSTTKEEKIYDQILFDTREFLTTYVKSPELQTCIMSVLEKQQFLRDFRESSNEIQGEKNFNITYGVRKPDGTPSCIMELYYESNELRTLSLETDVFSLSPNILAQFTNNGSPKFIVDSNLINVTRTIYVIPAYAEWNNVNLGFSREKITGKIAKGTSDSGVYLEAFLFNQGQSGFFISFPKIGKNL